MVDETSPHNVPDNSRQNRSLGQAQGDGSDESDEKHFQIICNMSEVETVDSTPAYLVTYTSLMILLLSFLIYINSLATPDDVRKRDTLRSLAKYFSVQTSTVSEQSKGTTKATSDVPIPELAVGFPRTSFAVRYAPVALAAEREGLGIERKDDNFLISIQSESLFASGDDQIRSALLPMLRRVAHEVMRFNLSLEIEGHTDNQPISTNRFPSNWELSIARAVSVLRFMLDVGVPMTRLSAQGRAEFRPIATNDTAEGRAKNRRIVLIVKESKS